MKSKDFIKIAQIADAHGIKGEVKLRSFSEDPDFFINTPILHDKNGSKTFEITVTGRVKEYVIARINNISDRNAAELLKNMELYIPITALPELEDGEFYYNDLIDLEARLPSGETYGIIIAVHNFGAGDIIEIETPSGKEMLPLREPWIIETNLKEGYVMVLPAEYS